MGCLKLSILENQGASCELKKYTDKKELTPNKSDLKGQNANRYGFQGQEVDNEIKGEGNSVNYKYRMHDPRVGRFFSVDPLTKKYPYYTPYAFSGNRVLDAVELEGLEPSSIHVYMKDDNGDVIHEFHKNAEGTGHLGDHYLENTLPTLGVKSKDFALNSNVIIIYNVDSKEIENIFENNNVKQEVPKKKQEETQQEERSSFEKHGPLGVIIGDKNATAFGEWEQNTLNNGRAPLPLRLLVKALPGPSLVDAVYTLATGKDMMSPNREGANGLGYGSSATTVGTGTHDLLGGTSKLIRGVGIFNSFFSIASEIYETYKEGGFDSSNNNEDGKDK